MTDRPEDLTERSEAQEDLRQSRAQLHLYERIVQNIHEALLVTEADPIDLPGPRIVYVNPAFEQMTGYSAHEIVGQTPRILQGPKTDRRELDNIRTALHKQEPVQAQLVNYRKDGTEFEVEFEIVPLHDDTGKTTHLIAIERDITARKHEAEILRESQEHLEIAIEAARLGLWEWNLKTNALVWSGNNERLFGMQPGQFDGKFETFLQCIHPEDREGLAKARETARNTRSQYRHTYRVIWPDGTIHWLSGSGHFFYDAAGEATHAAGAIIDVTDRQNLHEDRLQMAAIAERRAVTLEATRRIVLDILLNRTGVEVLTHIAEAARTLVQARYAALSMVDSNGICLQDFITVGLSAEQEHAIGSLPAGESLLRRMLTRTEPMRIETTQTHPASLGFPSGYPPVESFLGVPIRSGSKVLGAFYLTNREDGAPFTDGDAEAIAALADYAAVAIHHQQLLHQQSLLMHRFINTLEDERRSVAYELHDGLTQYVMTSYLVLSTFAAEHCARSQAPMPEKLAKGLEYMQQAVLEARRMVNGLRSLSLDDLGLVGALERLVEEERERAGWDTLTFEHNLEEMRFDTALETAVYRVAQEALTNARKYAETSRVRVTLLRRKGVLPDREYLVLEVYDWGKGFDTQKTRESYEHLGMHSMEERVRLMQGTFEIVSAPGQGTLIHAVFPLPIRQEPLPLL